jgi:hypothetical protein
MKQSDRSTPVTAPSRRSGIRVAVGLGNFAVLTLSLRSDLCCAYAWPPGAAASGWLGTGITRVYPETNRALHERVGTAGTLVSGFLSDCPPDKHTLALPSRARTRLAGRAIVTVATANNGQRWPTTANNISDG